MEYTQFNPVHYKTTIRGSSCTYFLKVKTAKTQKKYIELTESHKIGEDNFEQKYVRIYEEDVPKLAQELETILPKFFGLKKVDEVEDIPF